MFLESVTGIKFKGVEGNLKCVHLYDNAILEGIVLMNKENKKYSIPEVNFQVTEDLKAIDPENVSITNYKPEAFVKVEMLAPISNKQ